MHPPRFRAVSLIGLGNVGSQLADLLARMPEVDALTLIDSDVYSAENIATQNIRQGDVGQPKANVVARRLGEALPAVQLRPIVGQVEDVPLGILRGDVIVACTDSLASRLVISEAAWRLGTPLVDTGVNGDAALARVTLQIPQDDQPCLQCAWSERDYARLEQRYTCQHAAPSFSTNAPAWLGTLAASMAAAEIARLFESAGRGEAKTLFFEAARGHLATTRELRREDCRFNHQSWPVLPLDAHADEISFTALLARVETDTAALRVWNHPWVARRACPACHGIEIGWHLHGRRPDRCACGATLLALGFHTSPDLAPGDLSPELLDRPLSSFGLSDGDVVTLTHPAGRACFEIGKS